MKIHKIYIALGLIVAFTLFFELAAHAGEAYQSTEITFNRPVHSRPPRTHFSQVLSKAQELKEAVRIDPRLDPHRTSAFAPLIEPCGPLPVGYLQHLSKKDYAYGYIGIDDLTMDPILPPGSFIQIDEFQKRVLGAGWRSEYERPIYMLQTRDGYVCAWCTQADDELVLLPHPLSPVAPRIIGARDSDIIGQVVGAGIRLDGSRVGRDPATNREDQ